MLLGEVISAIVIIAGALVLGSIATSVAPSIFDKKALDEVASWLKNSKNIRVCSIALVDCSTSCTYRFIGFEKLC